MNANVRSALQQYGQTSTQSAIEGADPHRLIQMLLNGALDKIAIAKGAVERREMVLKSQHISWAVSIVNGLRMSLDKEAGGEIAENLDALYEYMGRRLMEANSSNDVATLDEVSGLLREIKGAWDQIPEEAKREHAQHKAAQSNAAVRLGA